MSLTKEQVREKMVEKDVVVLSVLPQEDFEKLHIAGSRSLPLTLDYGAFLHEIEKDVRKEKVLHYLRQSLDPGGRRQRGASHEGSGFQRRKLPGGIREWFDAGFPTEGTEMLRPV